MSRSQEEDGHAYEEKEKLCEKVLFFWCPSLEETAYTIMLMRTLRIVVGLWEPRYELDPIHMKYL